MTNNINTLIRKYLSGDISETEYKELSEALSNDQTASKRMEQIVEADDLTKRYADYATVDTKAALQKFIEQYVKEDERDVASPSKTRMLTPHFYRIAAVIALLIVGGAFWYHREYTRVTPPVITERVQLAMEQSRESGKEGADILSSTVTRQPVISVEECDLYHVDEDFVEQLAEARRITTYHNKEYWVTLDDGTLVHLNYNSRLIYPEKFGDRRDVILDGEAYFMVAKDKSRQFVVHTPQGDVKVYGTEFYVKTGSPSSVGEGSMVVLVQGSLGFTPNGGKEQMLQPGQQLNLVANHLSVSQIDTTSYIAWNEGKFIFNNWTLERILGVLSLWYDKKISFANDSLKGINLSGNFYRYNGLSPTLKALETVAGVKIKIIGEQIIIEN